MITIANHATWQYDRLKIYDELQDATNRVRSFLPRPAAEWRWQEPAERWRRTGWWGWSCNRGSVVECELRTSRRCTAQDNTRTSPRADMQEPLYTMSLASFCTRPYGVRQWRPQTMTATAMTATNNVLLTDYCRFLFVFVSVKLRNYIESLS